MVISSGSLPAGLTLTSTGAISGTPSTTGTSSFAATVSDSGNPIQTQSATLSIVVAATAHQDHGFGARPCGLWTLLLAVVAGDRRNANLQVVHRVGPTAFRTQPEFHGCDLGYADRPEPRPYASVSDSGNPVESVSAPMTITVAPGALTITGSSLPAISTGSAYAQTPDATGGAAPLSLDNASGQLPSDSPCLRLTGHDHGHAIRRGHGKLHRDRQRQQ